MSDSGLSALTQRVDRLERDLRWWKCVAGLGGMLAVAAGLLGQAPAGAPVKSVDAERFNLRDAGGNLRALLGTTSDGATSLLLYNATGVNQAGLGVMADGSTSVFLANPAGRTVTELTLYRDGTPTLVFRDRNGKTRTLMGTATDGYPFAYFLDAAGNNTWKAP
ncbi:MAG TPA: hypothetical protein VL948_13765 [Verrucomicrobiae bacterium]|jgi:hypothetical protein|nr:hypothetical protein [Verrucomicrobiae bacterium]